jgi:uncharacterized membrane protein YjjB (DUF3815 family)
MVAAAGVDLKVGPAVVGGLFLYLPGRVLVSSVIDGLSNAPLSAVARGIQAVVAAGALAVGMLVGSKIGAGLGLNYSPNVAATPIPISVLGAVVGMFGLAVIWEMPRRLLMPTLGIGAIGWLVVALTTSQPGEGKSWVAYALGAAMVGVCGALLAKIQDAPASIYTGVAILPLVPGFTLYQGVLALSQGKNALAIATLGEAAIISLAIAVGVAFGIALGRNLLAIKRRVSLP